MSNEKEYRPIHPHVHELEGSTKISGGGCCCEEIHNHHFATVSGNVIPKEESHVHEVKFTTDTFDGHEHEFCGLTSKAIPVGDGRHVHFINNCTDICDEHKHGFRVATLIDNPIECK